MKLNDDEKHFTLSTGREFYAHSGLLSVKEEDGEIDTYLYYGYDGWVREDWDSKNEKIVPKFTSAEREEIADYMIALWQKWKEKHAS